MNHNLIGVAAIAAMIAAGSAFAAEPAPMAAAPAPMAAAPAPMHHVSACAKAIHSAEHSLKMSKAAPDAISGAWNHIEMAKQAQKSHDHKGCKSEAMAASKML